MLEKTKILQKIQAINQSASATIDFFQDTN